MVKKLLSNLNDKTYHDQIFFIKKRSMSLFVRQARTHNLLVQNRELLEHINALVRQLQVLEARLTGADVTQLINTPASSVNVFLMSTYKQ